jgi:hypothetical protein
MVTAPETRLVGPRVDESRGMAADPGRRVNPGRPVIRQTSLVRAKGESELIRSRAGTDHIGSFTARTKWIPLPRTLSSEASASAWDLSV